MRKNWRPSKFKSSEDGAITVDWTVMTAAIIALGFAVTLPIATGAGKMGASIGSALGAEDVELAEGDTAPEPLVQPAQNTQF